MKKNEFCFTLLYGEIMLNIGICTLL